MLRIISGQLRSLLFDAPNWGLARPMSDRARLALFNMLGDLADCQLVLDAYGGSGALAFEALSRGAQRAVIMESQPKVYAQLIKNIAKLKLNDKVEVYKANNVTCATNLEYKYDLIFLDPPYNNIREANLLKLASFLKTDGRLVLSHPPYLQSPFLAPDWLLLQARQYAQACITIYQKQVLNG
ncbi:MAG: 23S rRNA (adenine(2030)-N(6))-methyltransferase RlmJ [Candidatus Saccharibacteria bacterium]|nr:23S rRNA (adenine(2030)-N(6))-methyltransferase RlmJ [Candidatus Saccharibacteria bacterium]